MPARVETDADVAWVSDPWRVTPEFTDNGHFRQATAVTVESDLPVGPMMIEPALLAVEPHGQGLCLMSVPSRQLGVYMWELLRG
jgi:hypothetical protein